MTTANKVKNALFGSFQNRVKGFRRIDMNRTSGKFFNVVVDAFMAGERLLDTTVVDRS